MRVNDTNRAMVLACLYNASHIQGLGFLSPDGAGPDDMTLEEAEKILENCYAQDIRCYFDYLKGRVMKINLGGKGTIVELDFRLYDRDNGQGAGERACKGLEI